MKNNIYIFLIFVLTFFISCDKNEKPINPFYNDVIEKLSDAIEYEIKDKDLNAISIAIIKQNDFFWSEGFGFIDEEKKIKADENTIYRVGSVSKLFTDIAIMKKRESGDIDIDSPLQIYLPKFNPENKFNHEPITLRQLMSHRAGILREPAYGNYFADNETSLKKTVESVKNSPLIHPPGTITKYSNAGIAVVGYTLEKVFQKPYVEFMQQNILNPLGMNASSFEFKNSMSLNLAEATMWSYDGRSFKAPRFELGMIPAGSLYSSVTDLTKFLNMILSDGSLNGERFVNPNTLKEMFTPQFSDSEESGYGIGFRVSKHYGYKMISHGGAIYGYSTQLSALPEPKIGVVVASSVDISNSITRKISSYALDLLIAKEKKLKLPEYVKTKPIKKEIEENLIGDYENEANRIRIKKIENQIIFENDYFEVPIKEFNSKFISDGKINQGGILIERNGDNLIINKKQYKRVMKNSNPDFPKEWLGLIGEYGWDHNIIYVYEDAGSLWVLIEWIEKNKLIQESKSLFKFPDKTGMYRSEKLNFKINENGIATEVSILNGPIFKRRSPLSLTKKTFKISPVKPIEILRKEAENSNPPMGNSESEKFDLVEIKNIDRSIKYDIRYASENNFMGSKFYKTSNAFLQRPAAEALKRVNEKLRSYGFGLLIHDAYRPWYVTKMFWDATPVDKKIFVANPQNGSRHNRGCAVDLTLYELSTGNPVEMISGYDEFTDRAFPYYYGGTTKQRWLRDLLRENMESEGFRVYEYEWWHFDYKDWDKYGIGNLKFEDIK
ncbi:MAG: serine hydrolase [Flavobacteriales bacterium TMED96]|nr:MAG: serine hydrolase [Flavobacteriales bacterium TMED96]